MWWSSTGITNGTAIVNFRSAKMMNVEDDDVFIATYPKCGTTWLQHICHQLIRGENYQAAEGNGTSGDFCSKPSLRLTFLTTSLSQIASYLGCMLKIAVTIVR